MGELSKGSVGPDVKKLQTSLNFQLAGLWPPLMIDGIFGPKTKASTIEFQQLCDVTDDGIVGPVTTRELNTVIESTHHLVVVRKPRSSKKAVNLGIAGRSLSKPPVVGPFPESVHQIPQVKEHPYRKVLKEFHMGAEGAAETHFTLDFSERDFARELFVAANIKMWWARDLGKKTEFGRRWALEVGLGFTHERNFANFDEHETSAFLYSKGALKLLDSEHLTLPAIAELRAAIPNPIEKPATFSAAIGIGPEIKFARDHMGLGFNIFLNYSVDTRGRQKLSGILGPSLSIHF